MERLLGVLLIVISFSKANEGITHRFVSGINPIRSSLYSMQVDDSYIHPREIRNKTRKITPVVPKGDYIPLVDQTFKETVAHSPKKRDSTINVVAFSNFPGVSKSPVAEPAVASHGSFWFYTMNWDAGFILGLFVNL